MFKKGECEAYHAVPGRYFRKDGKERSDEIQKPNCYEDLLEKLYERE